MTRFEHAGLASAATIRNELGSGDVESLVDLHAVLYAREFGWNSEFAAYVAKPLREFERTKNPRERIWLVDHEGQTGGAIAIVEAADNAAQLRWFLLLPRLRGVGLGSYLVNEAIGFSRESGYSSIYLWTVSLLEAAAHVYLAAGFSLSEEKSHSVWGKLLTEQRYDLQL
jgi:GNAT superfamily N-acetyltransferase